MLRVVRHYPDWVHWAMLAAMARLGTWGRDLAGDGSHALLLAVACHDVMRPGPRRRRDWRWVQRLVGKPRREVVGKLGFPPREASVRLLKRVTAAGCDPFLLVGLQQAMHDSARLRRLTFLPRLDTPVLRVLAHPLLRRAVHHRVLLELAAMPTQQADELTRPVLSLAGELLAMGQMKRLPPVRSIGRLRQLGEELPGVKLAPLPPSPVLDLPGQVEALSCPWQVLEEGRQMHHCVASYVHRVRQAGGGCIFRIHGDDASGLDRATLWASPDASGRWHVRQLRGRQNQDVSPATHALAEQVAAECTAATPAPTGHIPVDPEDIPF